MKAPHPVFRAAMRLDGLGQAMLSGQPVALSGLALTEMAAVLYAAATEIRELHAQVEATAGLQEALDAAIQCETDVLDVYQRRTSLQTLDLAVAELKRDSLPKLKAARAALAQAGGEVQQGIPAWGLGTNVVYVGPRPNDYPNIGALRVIPSMHAHLTRVSDGRAEFSAPHAHFAQAQAGAGDQA